MGIFILVEIAVHRHQPAEGISYYREIRLTHILEVYL